MSIDHASQSRMFSFTVFALAFGRVRGGERERGDCGIWVRVSSAARKG